MQARPVDRLPRMHGVDATTGKRLSGIDHLRQSVSDILRTPIGSRVMRREYGSQLFALTDAPLNQSGVMDLYAATAEALKRWEPRFSLTSVKAAQPQPGVVTLDLVGRYLPDGQTVTLDGIEVDPRSPPSAPSPNFILNDEGGFIYDENDNPLAA